MRWRWRLLRDIPPARTIEIVHRNGEITTHTIVGLLQRDGTREWYPVPQVIAYPGERICGYLPEGDRLGIPVSPEENGPWH